ncbi:MAG: glycosyltransferase family 4 protein [candidate division NC10 bacterium]|nr:glycosyltransferase family 4 protein [candidate division NC10 bacterium]
MAVRILHVITRLDRGGSATNTLLTVAGLPPRFHQSLAFGRRVEFPKLALELQGKVEMVEVTELVRNPSPVKDLVALFKIYRLIRRGRFDLVHTHTSKAGILGRVAARLAGVPRIVHTPHGHIFTGYAGWALTILFILLERWAATFTDRIIGLTDREIRDHLDRKIGRPEQFVRIPSGIDVERFERAHVGAGFKPALASAMKASLGLPPSARLIGSVGRLEPIKGHRYLLEAFRDLAPRFPDLYWALVGEGELLPKFRSYAQSEGLADRVLFLGWRDDLPALFQTFDLFVHPSLNEGMGRALVEAMAAGLPIVATRVCGIPEVLGEGEAGLLVEAESAPALAQGIEKLLLDPAQRTRLGKAAQKRARRYSVEVMLQKIEALYQELLREGER